MNPSEPIPIPPELANVPEPDRTLVAIYARHKKPERIVRLPELAHIPERHRVFALALFAVRDLHSKPKAKWHDELPSAVFVTTLLGVSVAGTVVGFSIGGERGGIIGFALGMTVALSLGAFLLHRSCRKSMRAFFQSEDCRSFIEKLKNALLASATGGRTS